VFADITSCVQNVGQSFVPILVHYHSCYTVQEEKISQSFIV